MDHHATCEKGLKRTTYDNSYLSDQAECIPSTPQPGSRRMTERALTLRAVKTVDFMTAKFAHLPFEFSEEISRRIINEVHGIS
jgi:GMP synthase PP-ATPase subunit